MRFSSFVAPILGGLTVFIGSAHAVDRTTEAGEATILNPQEECTYYDYPPNDSTVKDFPPNWVQPAILLPNDATAQALWAKIAPSIPTNIAPRGTVNGNFAGVNYPATDPDCWWTYGKCTTPKLAGLVPDITGIPEPQSLGYGFDDGPNCSHNAFYDFLTEQQQKATMFYIGSNVQNWPLEAQRAVVDGHEICVHTWSHPYMTSVSSEGAFAELYYAREMIKHVTGVTPKCWRPPYGDVDDRIRAIASALDLTTVVWQYDSDDWEVGDTDVPPSAVDANYEALIARAQNGTFNTAGTIMLTHELDNFTMSEAIKFYPKLKAAFKYLVPVGVGMNWTQPYAETNITLPSFAQYISGQITGNSSSSSSSGSATPPGASASSKPANGSSSKSGAVGMARSGSACLVVAAALVAGVVSVLA